MVYMHQSFLGIGAVASLGRRLQKFPTIRLTMASVFGLFSLNTFAPTNCLMVIAVTQLQSKEKRRRMNLT